MEVEKEVVVSKGEHTDGRGVIVRQVGIGHGRKWVVRFDNDAEIEFHARSLQIEDEYDGSEDEKQGDDERKEGDRGGKPHDHRRVVQEDPDDGPADEEEFDDDWRAMVDGLM